MATHWVIVEAGFNMTYFVSQTFLNSSTPSDAGSAPNYQCVFGKGREILQVFCLLILLLLRVPRTMQYAIEGEWIDRRTCVGTPLTHWHKADIRPVKHMMKIFRYELSSLGPIWCLVVHTAVKGVQ